MTRGEIRDAIGRGDGNLFAGGENDRDEDAHPPCRAIDDLDFFLAVRLRLRGERPELDPER